VNSPSMVNRAVVALGIRWPRYSHHDRYAGRTISVRAEDHRAVEMRTLFGYSYCKFALVFLRPDNR
jgi:hypothetical protein